MRSKKQRKEAQRKNKIKIFEKYSLLLLVATLFMSVAFAQISDVELNITGELVAPVQSGVFISDIEQVSATGVNSSEINYYRKTTVSSSVTFTASSSASLKYKIKVYNNSSDNYYFKGVTFDSDGYSNSNIEFSLSGIEAYKTKIEPREELEFTIEFKYKSGYTPSSSQTLNSLLNFEFGNTYINFTIGTKTDYKAPSGASWEQFINSEWNTYGLSTSSGVFALYSNGNPLLHEGSNDNYVQISEIISSTEKYNYIIEFSINSTGYRARNGMTWAEWVSSNFNYNSSSATPSREYSYSSSSYGGKVYRNLNLHNGDLYCVSGDGFVIGSDLIVEDKIYIIARPTINFKINGKTYTAYELDSWMDWVKTNFNTEYAQRR